MFRRFFAVIFGLLLLVPTGAFAATPAPWAVEVGALPGKGALSMAPGEVRDIHLAFKNTSSRTWKNDGPAYISLYTFGPKYRVSPFDPGTWLSPTQVRRLNEASVVPGATGTLDFSLRAPTTPGVYTETFALAAESVAWLNGGTVTFTVTVVPQAAAAPTTPVAPTPTAPPSVEVVAQSASLVTAKAGKPVLVQIALKNTGTAAWTSVALGQPNSAFAHSSWSATDVVRADGVNPGKTAQLTAILRAPAANGTHQAVLPILLNGQPSGKSITLAMTVKDGSRGTVIRDETPTEPAHTYIPEPNIRVGVLLVDEETNNEVVISAADSAVEVRTASGVLIDTLSAGKTGRAAYANGVYEYGSGRSKQTFAEPLRFVTVTPNAILTITNFDRRVTRGTLYANNTFRNVLELRFNSKKNRAWLINELSIESYLKGLAEAGNSHPVEFQKALNVAARSYAYFQMLNGGTYKAEGFDVDAYRDQVYWGADQELRNPKLAEAVEATRGQVVTYQGQVAITSYFSSSDGQTRNWSDVWSGNRPYARAVPVPCDAGKRLNGHGVGMSLSGAICMANNGQSMDAIITYFYTGVAVEKYWE